MNGCNIYKYCCVRLTWWSLPVTIRFFNLASVASYRLDESPKNPRHVFRFFAALPIELRSEFPPTAEARTRNQQPIMLTIKIAVRVFLLYNWFANSRRLDLPIAQITCCPCTIPEPERRKTQACGTSSCWSHQILSKDRSGVLSVGC